MNQNLHNLFKNIAEIEPEKGLERRILRKIELESEWQKKKKLALVDSGILLSLGALVFSVLNFWGAIIQSEFWSLISLAFSDAGTVLSFWKDYALSLLETLPVLEIAAILAPIFAILFLISWYLKLGGRSHYYYV